MQRHLSFLAKNYQNSERRCLRQCFRRPGSIFVHSKIVHAIEINASSTTVRCSQNQSCIKNISQHTPIPVPNCTRPGCDDALKPKTTNYRSFEIKLCDQEAANYAKLALDELLQINKVFALVMAAGKRDAEAYAREYQSDP